MFELLELSERYQNKFKVLQKIDNYVRVNIYGTILMYTYVCSIRDAVKKENNGRMRNRRQYVEFSRTVLICENPLVIIELSTTLPANF